MKTHLFFINILLILSQQVLPQTNKYIEFNQTSYSGLKKLDFSKFNIIDARQDSSKVGYTGYYQVQPRILTCKNGMASDLNNFLNSYYKTSFTESNYSVLIVIKKLWISQFDSSISIGNNLFQKGRILIAKIKLELYLKSNNDYFPIMRIDTSYFTNQRHSAKALENEIADGITNCCDTLFSINISKILQRKKITLGQIEAFNKKLADVPILNATNYNKGVFMTFDEFLNNQPSADYKNINQTKFGDVLYLKDDNGEYPSNKFWGYSDGKNLYITSGKNFFQLKRVQNTFEFFGIKNLKLNYGSTTLNPRTGQGQFGSSRTEMDMFYYQVDMETGEAY